MRLKVMLMAAALLASPAYSQAPLDLEAGRLQGLVNLSETMCRAAYQSGNAVTSLRSDIDALRLPASERLVMLSLCQSYGHGYVDGLDRGIAALNRLGKE